MMMVIASAFLLVSALLLLIMIFSPMLNYAAYCMERRVVLDEYLDQLDELYAECGMNVENAVRDVEGVYTGSARDMSALAIYEQAEKRVQFLGRIYGRMFSDMESVYLGTRSKSREEIR